MGKDNHHQKRKKNGWLSIGRRTLAVVFITAITLLFLDFTATAHHLFGWMVRIQFLPALLALNVGVIVALIVMTLLLGRIYCSVICPLGVMQDLFGRLGKHHRKNRYSYSPAKNVLRGIVLALFVLALVAGFGAIAALLAPYSAYGRIVQSLVSPLWQWGNNLLAGWAARNDSYMFYSVDIWAKSLPAIAVAAVTLVVTAVLAWRNGRSYCNTVCPVGTVLGFLARFALLRPVIDTSKCNGCGLCARNCKGACIDSKNHIIDYSRCVDCMDCIDKCTRGAISYTYRRPAASSTPASASPDHSRRTFIATAAAIAATSAVKAQEKTVDGGLAAITDKKIPDRQTPVVPPGARGLRHMATHCTACQLCVTVCPNQVLRPSGKLENFMQPESSFERGYCRPECTKCSEVCPSGAIEPITVADKSSIQVGHAVWIRENCLPAVDGIRCGNCARHCPAGAITMVASDASNPDSPLIPAVNTERCIGCGACENLCPSRPFSAIYVEGHRNHRTI